ncbi:MAG: retroviral-like aspartic protease family protein [Thermoplasmata archaeon]|nr:retroviral-like aspartic protease family protein [Thermoplasmata archaeon]
MAKRRFVFAYFHYPLIPVQFIHGNKKTPIIEALIDSGGDSVVIPRAIAKYLGSPLEKTNGAKTAGGMTDLLKTRLDLVIGRDGEKYQYTNLEVYVVDSDDIPVLLGRYPLFDDFEIIFQKKRGKLILQEA